MKACSRPPFRPSSPGELPHFKRKWIILWNEWRHVHQWLTVTDTHKHTHHIILQRFTPEHIHTAFKRLQTKKKSNTHISIKILPTETNEDVQIKRKTSYSPWFLFECLTICRKEKHNMCYCPTVIHTVASQIFIVFCVKFQKKIKSLRTMWYLFLFFSSTLHFLSGLFLYISHIFVLSDSVGSEWMTAVAHTFPFW